MLRQYKEKKKPDSFKYNQTVIYKENKTTKILNWIIAE